MHILDSALRHFFIWLAMVLLATWGGYPGVVCITPMAWLLALSAGTRCAARSPNPLPGRRILEAAAAGGLLGLLQGVLFIFFAPFIGEVAPDERISTILISALILVVGVLVSAGLAAFNAWLLEQRLMRQNPPRR
jgi:hypothetical protein